ncbi:MAG: acyl-CoA/acyl-ACP dehydrogenase [Deltaproteobacteria bacterium]|nr:acyl-CoA/acyl-ACP dehydrogenase [Deltaproteobacteria bacterium]
MAYFDCDLNLSWEDIALRDAAHKFAAEVMRPVGRELDRLSPEQAAGPKSPIWEFLRKGYELNYHKVLIPPPFGGLGLSSRQVHLVEEELGWGSFGLSALLASAGFAFTFAAMTGDEELIRTFSEPYAACTDASMIGCWAVTEPDHGSDLVSYAEEFFRSPKLRADARATLDGDEWVVSGQKSAWISGAPIATHALVHLQVEPSRGLAGFGMCIIPLAYPGVSRGKPLRKIGQRDLCQGEIFFDDVRIPRKWMLIGPDAYVPTLQTILAHANAMMATWATGLARAAFEEAFAYARERVQGTRPIVEHYSVRQRLFQLFARVETCRATSRAVVDLNLNVSPPLVEYSVAAKTTCTQLCFENAHEALQLLGGNGLTQEYAIEKLFRDARATLIMDGNNEVLAASAGAVLAESYPRSQLLGVSC